MSSIFASGSIAEPELLREIADAPPSRVVVEQNARPSRLGGEHDVLGDGHDRDEHEVLVHHPEPRLDRVLGRSEGDGLPADEDLALVGLVEPVQDVHEGRLARAVLAEERVHLAAREVEADVVVGEHAGELLDDPAHLEDGGLAHPPDDSMALGQRAEIQEAGTWPASCPIDVWSST